MTLHQGDCVHLTSDEHLYQVIAVDDHQNRCWVRRWPMARHGSPVFEISLHLVDGQLDAGHPGPPIRLGLAGAMPRLIDVPMLAKPASPPSSPRPAIPIPRPRSSQGGLNRSH